MSEDEMRIPDIEVVVGASGNDAAVFAFYRREDIHQGYEVVSVVTGRSAVAVIRKILQDCVTSLNDADWVNVDKLLEDEATEVEDPPF